MEKFKKILMLDFTDEKLEPQYWEQINEMCEQKVLIPKDSPEVPNHLADTDCILVDFLPTVDKERIDATPNLKYVGILATGYGRIDAEHAATKNIPVCNIPGYSTEAVAEFAFSTILEQLRDLERAKKHVREGHYTEEGFKGTELKDKVFGVVGLGNIGRRTAEIALEGFKADTRYWSKNRKQETEDKGIKYQELSELMKESDFISLNLSLNKETEGIITKDMVDSIKPGAILLNLAPMELIDMNGLDEKLGKEDIIFILDHTDELSPENIEILKKHKNCIMYPPIAYLTKESKRNQQDIFVANLKKFLEGTPQNVVNL